MTDAPTAPAGPTAPTAPADGPTAALLDGHRPLEVPPGAEAVDLEAKFTQLLFRSSLLGNKLTEQKQQARAEQRELLGVLIEVDDALTALALDRELVALGRGAGLEATRRRLLGRLAKAGVRPMRLEGLAADPALTEIVGTEVRPGVAPETVLQTVVTGFFWEQEVLRRAQVVVAAAESAAESAPESVPEPVPVPVEDPRSARIGLEEPEQPEEPKEPERPTAAAPDPAARPVPPRVRRHAKAPGRPAKRAKRKK
ncbi:nucleotide exchange factor GrpE [Kitasatospora sp. NPDC056076]|uniref:nucleotide exchange factor GrpE n=1 Tax=Kitasatospora sp. NPDC056076 TaxID=3345703 RepID=UPI0035E24721